MFPSQPSPAAPSSSGGPLGPGAGKPSPAPDTHGVVGLGVAGGAGGSVERAGGLLRVGQGGRVGGAGSAIHVLHLQRGNGPFSAPLRSGSRM